MFMEPNGAQRKIGKRYPRKGASLPGPRSESKSAQRLGLAGSAQQISYAHVLKRK